MFGGYAGQSSFEWRLIPGFLLSVVVLVVVGMTVLALVASAVAADLPVPPKGVSVEQMRAAIRAHDAKKKMTSKQFERNLQSPIGEGRLE